MAPRRPRPARRHLAWRPLLVLAGLALSSTGCSRLLASYDVAPNGLSRRDDSLRRMLASGQADSALARLAPQGKTAPSDELLRSLYEGILAHYAGGYAESGAALQRAADLAEERYTKRISRAALSLITSDQVLPYEPGRSERLLIHYYGALNYLRRDDLEGAAVEARRLAFLLERGRGQETEARVTPLLAFLRYFTGTVFEAAGETNDAEVAYRNAAALLGTERPALPEPLPAAQGEVVVLLEQGFVAHRVEQSVVVPLHPVEAGWITGGEGERRLATAAGVAARVVAHALLSTSQSAYAHGTRPPTLYVDPPDARLFEEECEKEAADSQENGNVKASTACDVEGDVPYILRIAWPVYRLDDRPATGLRVVGEGVEAAPLVRFDVSDAVRADFEAERAMMLARTVARATAKLALTRGVEKTVGEKDEAVARVLGVITNLGTALLEQADTRSWQLLPGQVAVARLRLPPGTHALAAEVPGEGSEPARRIALGSVQVRPGRTTFLSARTWRQAPPP